MSSSIIGVEKWGNSISLQDIHSRGTLKSAAQLLCWLTWLVVLKGLRRWWLSRS